MSTYALIKIISRIQRADTISDLTTLNCWLDKKGISPILSYGPSLRALENSVSLGLEKITDKNNLPKLVRGLSFYEGCIPEIKEKEREKFIHINK